MPRQIFKQASKWRSRRTQITVFCAQELEEASIHTLPKIHGSVKACRYSISPLFQSSRHHYYCPSISQADNASACGVQTVSSLISFITLNRGRNHCGQPCHQDRHKDHQSFVLTEAAHDGNLRDASKAISLGADLDFEFPRTPDMEDPPHTDGTTPLMVADGRDHVHIVKLLLNKGAETSKARKDRVTALHVAAKRGSNGAARLLLDAGADVNCLNGEQRTTPIFFAVYNRHAGLVKLLLERGADANLGPLDRSPMDAAAAARHAGITGMLLAAGWAAEPPAEASEALSDARLVQRIYATMCMGCYRCSGLDNGVKLKQCSLCLEVSYCSRECQKKSWKEGHREDCTGRRKMGD